MVALRQISEQRDFVVSSASLKDVRSFSREVFEKVNIDQDLKDELVLAIAEAAQNIVKHAYQGEDTDDKMEIKISLNNGELEIGFFDKGRPVDKNNVRHINYRNLLEDKFRQYSWYIDKSNGDVYNILLNVNSNEYKTNVKDNNNLFYT